MGNAFEIKQLEFPHAFFEDEVREGFYVPNMMKRFWAAQMEVLKVFSGICARHDIPWYAGEGTLLGAVRHKGYIPWDDDIDLYMMRPEYERFLKIAKQELREPYYLFTIYDDPEATPCTIRLVSEQKMRFDDAYLEQYHGCPFSVGIDVFALDSVFDDPQEEAERMEKVRRIREACKDIEEGTENSSAFRQKILLIERENNVRLKEGKKLYHALHRLKEDLYASCRQNDTKQVAIFWELWAPGYYRRTWFQERITMPFEVTVLPVPAEYETFLNYKYGDYRIPVRGGGGHGYPCYNVQLEITMNDAKRKLYAYNYRTEDFLKEREVSKRAHALQTAQTLVRAYEQTEAAEAAGNTAGAAALRAGTAKLEEAFGRLTADTGGRDYLDGHREVVLIACRAAWWKTMENAYRKFQQEENTDVYVIVHPWYEKELDGSVSAEHDEADLFPDDIRVLTSAEYSIENRCPDVIVIQFPFDGWNRTVAIPPFYFAVNLRQYTDRLIYIPGYDLPTPDPGDDKAIISLQNLIEQPAVMYADEVWLRDEAMCTLYVEWLCKLGGEDIREICNRKIVVNPAFGRT